MNNLVLILIAANVLASMKGFNDIVFFDKYKFQIGKIQKGETVRTITSGFLHVDWTHLLFNMYALYLFGSMVTSNFSSFWFLVIYFGSLLGGSFYSLKIHGTNKMYNAVGASGAISGIMIVAIMLYPDRSFSFLFFPIISFKAYVLGIGYLLYSIYGMKNRIGDNIGHAAHLGGAMGGYIIALLSKPIIFNNNKLMVSILGILILALFFIRKK